MATIIARVGLQGRCWFLLWLFTIGVSRIVFRGYGAEASRQGRPIFCVNQMASGKVRLLKIMQKRRIMEYHPLVTGYFGSDRFIGSALTNIRQSLPEK